MRSLICFCSLLLSCAPAHEVPVEVAPKVRASPKTQTATVDHRISWLREHTYRMRSISPWDEDFEDLEPLRQVFAKASVVALGEQSHRDGSTFEAKIRLVKFLHQRLGYDVLAFESGLYDCHQCWQHIAKGEDAAKEVRRCLFGIWTKAEQVQPLFHYLGRMAKTDRPLELAGFDCQLTGSASQDDLLADLRRVLKAAQPPVTQSTWEDIDTAIKRARDWDNPPPLETRERGIAATLALRNTLAAPAVKQSLSSEEHAFWTQVLKSFAAYVDYRWREPQPTEDDIPGQINPRDGQMADNLLWLVRNPYRERKVIVWAATMHLSRNVGTIENLDESFSYRGVIPTGQLVKEALGSAAYILGFTAYQGARGPLSEPKDIGTAPAGSLEALLHQAGIEHGIVDLRSLTDGGELLRSPLVSRPHGYLRQRASWPEVLDGMAFVRVMVPSINLPE